MKLTEFLLARIAEDEAAALSRLRGHRELPETERESRVFAECKAKRRIVEWAAPVLTNWPGAAAGARHVSDDGLDVLRILALPYADHPDYDEEWRP